MNTLPRIGYVGMTHLGICSAVAAASKGFNVLGYASDKALIEELGVDRLPVVEPDLDNLVRAHRERIEFSSDPGRLTECDVIYVAPDIPTDDQNGSDLGTLDDLLALTFAYARGDSVIVILSQVPPGYTRAQQIRGSARDLLFYQVETLIFGRAVERATRPERFILGCADPAAPLPASLARFLAAFDCPILPMRFESAELAKIAINCCLVAVVSASNTLAEICETIGADWAEIVPALRLDRRIGPYAYLAPGLGIAGGNLERDLATVVRLGDANGTDVGVVRAWQSNSRYRRDWVLRILHQRVLTTSAKFKLAVLGLAYKENTHSTKNSPSLGLLAVLPEFEVVVHDPVVKPQPSWHPRLSTCADPIEACDGADALVIMTPWPEYMVLKPAQIADHLRGTTVIDPFGCLNSTECAAAGLSHFMLGQNPSS